MRLLRKGFPAPDPQNPRLPVCRQPAFPIAPKHPRRPGSPPSIRKSRVGQLKMVDPCHMSRTFVLLVGGYLLRGGLDLQQQLHALDGGDGRLGDGGGDASRQEVFGETCRVGRHDEFSLGWVLSVVSCVRPHTCTMQRRKTEIDSNRVFLRFQWWRQLDGVRHLLVGKRIMTRGSGSDAEERTEQNHRIGEQRGFWEWNFECLTSSSKSTNPTVDTKIWCSNRIRCSYLLAELLYL